MKDNDDAFHNFGLKCFNDCACDGYQSVRDKKVLFVCIKCRLVGYLQL